MTSTIAKLAQEIETMKEQHEEEREWLRDRIHLLRKDFSRLHDLYFDKVKKIDEEVSIMKEYLTTNKDFKRWALTELMD
tara:strand:- start:2352 stop:2588 length:237 start_codon:yes stop_codon:yes gene_type:complete